MRTSLRDIEKTESWLTETMPGPDALVFEAHMLTNPSFSMNVAMQKMLYHLIRLYNRKVLKQQIETLHDKIFNDISQSEFQRTIHQIFEDK